MQFAVNWSPEAVALIEENTIEVDLFKCPDWEHVVDQARSLRPAYVHFPLVIGNGQAQAWDIASIEDWLSRTDTRFVNCHIVPIASQFDESIGLDGLTDHLVAEVQQLVDAFGQERVIIENCPLFDYNFDLGIIEQAGNPELFQRIVSATGCGFLLDMAHHILTSQHFGWDFRETIHHFPTDHIREFHITGVDRWSTGTLGDHMPMTESDWNDLAYCMAQFQCGAWRIPDVIAFEYGGIEKLKQLCGSDRDKLAEQVPRLYALAHQLAP